LLRRVRVAVTPPSPCVRLGLRLRFGLRRSRVLRGPLLLRVRLRLTGHSGQE
jgi:hypothetical protein